MHSIYKETTNLLQFTIKSEKPNLSPAHQGTGLSADSVSRRPSHVMVCYYSTNSTTAVMFQSKRSSWLSGLTTTL